MKIILSRKGFDASVGKVASPIFESGALCSLPIPESDSNSTSPRYEEIRFGDQSLGSIVSDLTRGKIQPRIPAHLDPDLNRESITRLTGWKPAFGQAGAAERHLQNRGVGEGDVFLFYGWFRRVERDVGRYRYVQSEPDLHMLFGWLQIEQRIPVVQRPQIPVWAREQSTDPDSLYIATDQLHLPGVTIDRPGAGIFPCYHPALCLTELEPYLSRRTWRLPAWMYPGTRKSALTYHANPKRWEMNEGYTRLKSVGRGQEFVLDCDKYPEAVKWLADVLSVCTHPPGY